MTTVHTLASGSSGNALLVSCGETHILVDAGISCRRITASLRELGLAPDDLTAVLITHTHTDHISGLQTLLKRTAFPICVTPQTGRGLVYRLAGIEERLRELTLCRPILLGNCTVTAFPTAHDAPGACGFRLDTPVGSIGILTDTGYITDEALDILPGVDLAVLEANHDVETLRSGSYPYYLKQRILGDEGHLSNENAARFAVTLAEAGASEIILAHLSRENNTPDMAQNAVALALSAAGFIPQLPTESGEIVSSGPEHSLILSVAPRDCLSRAHILSRRAVCRK